MSNLSFSDLSTPEGFKAFLVRYHDDLVTKRSFPKLGLGKALHIASAIFGAKDWNVLSSELRQSPVDLSEEGCYSLVCSFPQSEYSHESGISTQVVFKSLERCVDWIIRQIVERPNPLIDTSDPFLEIFSGAVERVGYDPDRIDISDTESFLGVLSKFDFYERCQVVDWYFNGVYFAWDDVWCLISHHDTLDGQPGSKVSLITPLRQPLAIKDFSDQDVLMAHAPHQTEVGITPISGSCTVVALDMGPCKDADERYAFYRVDRPGAKPVVFKEAVGWGRTEDLGQVTQDAFEAALVWVRDEKILQSQLKKVVLAGGIIAG